MDKEKLEKLRNRTKNFGKRVAKRSLPLFTSAIMAIGAHAQSNTQNTPQKDEQKPDTELKSTAVTNTNNDDIPVEFTEIKKFMREIKEHKILTAEGSRDVFHKIKYSEMGKLSYIYITFSENWEKTIHEVDTKNGKITHYAINGEDILLTKENKEKAQAIVDLVNDKFHEFNKMKKEERKAVTAPYNKKTLRDNR